VKHKIKSIHFVGTPDAQRPHRQPEGRCEASTPMPVIDDASGGIEVLR
jgi:hypothetical protein